MVTRDDTILAELARLDPMQSANPFWRERILKKDLGFHCERLALDKNADDPRIQEACLAADEINRMSIELSNFRQNLPKDQLAVYIYWLKTNGYYQGLMDFLDSNKMSFNSNAVRWYLQSRKIFKLAKRLGSSGRILEIGAGGGEMTYFTSRMMPWSLYVVVDLPPMLRHFYNNLSTRMAGASFYLNDWPAAGGERNIVLLDPTHVNLIPESFFDFGLNFNSFMEMDEGVRNGYIELIYRAVREGGIFYHVNRRQPKMTSLDGELFDNHPLLYPYRADDVVLEYDLDYAQQDVRCQTYRSYKRLPISRVAIVKSSPSGHVPGDGVARR